MGEITGIQWTNSSWNPWQGCTKVSPGCDNCYAEALDKRWGRDFSRLHRSADATFYGPMRWKGPRFVFTCSMSDFFHRQADPWRGEAWNIMRQTPHLTYQVLTKRPGLAVDWYKKHGWLPNVWLGTSVENQKYVPRLDVLAGVPAPILFLSAEPLLEALELSCPYLDGCFRPLDWVIVGAESGPHRRLMDVAWVQAIVEQCHIVGVPVFVKQGTSLWPGKQGQLPDSLWCIKEMPDARTNL